MKVIITDGANPTEYTEYKNLRYNTSVSVSGTQLDIDRVEVDLLTEDTIDYESLVLADDSDSVYANFEITKIDNEVKGIVHIVAESPLCILDKVELPASYYFTTNWTLGAELWDITRKSKVVTFDVDSSLENKCLYGYLPKQSARERLLAITFATGTVIVQGFVDGFHTIQIKSRTNTVKDIPIEHTYWRPTLDSKAVVGKVSVTAFGFIKRTPTRDEEYVNTGTDDYVVTRSVSTLYNPKESNWVEDELGLELTCVTSQNETQVLNQLVSYYFGGQTAEFNVLCNNAMYKAGGKYRVIMQEGIYVIGYAEHVDYTFGRQIKARIQMSVVEVGRSNELIITYKSEDNPPGKIKIGTRKHYFPAGYQFKVENPYLVVTVKQHKYVFRPQHKTLTGTMPSSGKKTMTEKCYVALDLNTSTKVLHIISVDEVNVVTEGSGQDAYRVAEIK